MSMRDKVTELGEASARAWHALEAAKKAYDVRLRELQDAVRKQVEAEQVGLDYRRLQAEHARAEAGGCGAVMRLRQVATEGKIRVRKDGCHDYVVTLHEDVLAHLRGMGVAPTDCPDCKGEREWAGVGNQAACHHCGKGCCHG